VTPPPLTDLLAAAQAALERDDVAAAARAVDAAARTCADMAARGVAPDPAGLGDLVRRHAQLEARALQTRDALSSRLAQAGRSRQAIRAYRGRRPG
jgi:hypothetical protein